MNILYFLTSKADVAYLYNDYTLRQALEKMEVHRYSSIPVIDREGRYVGTITEGDLLWYIKNDHSLNIRAAEHQLISDIHRHMDNKPIRIDTNMEDLLTTSMNQNFVPVIDDRDMFIGIVTRRSIMRYIVGVEDSPGIAAGI